MRIVSGPNGIIRHPKVDGLGRSDIDQREQRGQDASKRDHLGIDFLGARDTWGETPRER